jgi:hypothetical protein
MAIHWQIVCFGPRVPNPERLVGFSNYTVLIGDEVWGWRVIEQMVIALALAIEARSDDASRSRPLATSSCQKASGSARPETGVALCRGVRFPGGLGSEAIVIGGGQLLIHDSTVRGAIPTRCGVPTVEATSRDVAASSFSFLHIRS